ncbi:hypothetical protein VM1G_04425 [Cytospora mali]|uniref:Uncharacterized protein n=1 Tax=Cytospora mali TaxID=578113 RepID=A0A194VYA2_CYTMA|nr:hypothetical protein VM1G_04425 [Valsa mali]
MSAAANTSPTPGVGNGVGATSSTPAASAATPATTSETAAVTSSTTTAASTEQTTQTFQTSTPPTAETESSSSSPAVKVDPVTSSSTTPVSQVPSSQPTINTSSSQIPSKSPTLSTSPAAIVSSTATPVPDTSNGLSTGAVAGIAVGCAIAGLVIGILVAFLLLKRRSKFNPEPQIIETRTEGKSFDSRAFTVTPAETPSAVSDLDQFLLAPKPDKELAGELQSLGHLIEQHVEDNYHLFPVKQSISSLSEALAKLGLAVDEDMLPGPAQLAGMAANPMTRYVTLQHVISRVIFESLAVKSTSETSMLPPAVSSLMREMPPCEKHLGSPEAISQALTRWRQMVAFLLNPNRSERGSIIPDESSLAPQARDLVVAMKSFLGAFVEEEKSGQECHLQDVVLECARFGYMVLSQPADLEWKFETGHTEDLVVCPGLEKVSDSQGIGCKAEVICPPEVYRV